MPGGKGKIDEYNKSISEEQRKDNAKKAGEASAKAYKAKKTIAERCAMMINAQLSKENKDKLSKMYGELSEDATVAELMIAGQIQSAMKGNTKAFNAVSEYADRYSVANDSKTYELPARVLGKAFIDINRRIEPNKTYVFEGGRGGLKSSYIGFKLIELIKNNPTMHACVVRKVASTLKDSVYAQIKWTINELGLTDEFNYKTNPLEITYKKTGQKIFFRGADDPIKLKSIKPEFGYIGILWKEEKDQLNGAEEERSINQSVLRGNGSAFYDFSSYNPPKSKIAWVNKEKLIPDDNRIIHASTYLDAPPEWLGQKFIEDAEHLKEVNPEAYEHEYMGVANGEGGNVFEYVEIRRIEDKELDRFDRVYQGVDWGWFPDPFAFIRLAYDAARETVYLIDEHYANKEVNAVTGQWIKDKGYDDFTIVCDSAENKSVNDYKDIGLPARSAIKGAGSVDYGFKWLASRKIVIDPKRTPYALKEFTEYEYLRDKDGNVISGYPDANNHILDATRYALEQFYNKRGNLA